MALLGPNCYGLLNYLDGVALWPDQHGGERRGARRGHRHPERQHRPEPRPCNAAACRWPTWSPWATRPGDRIDAVIDALLDDPRVTAIGLHIEGLDDVVAVLARGACSALERGVPLVALKAG